MKYSLLFCLLLPWLAVQANEQCQQEGQLQSPDSKQPISVVFENQHAQMVHIYWLDEQGQRQLYSRLDSGKRFNIRTDANHVWLVADANEDCLAIYTVTENSTITLGSGVNNEPVRDAALESKLAVLFDWATQQYPDFFPQVVENQVYRDWIYRYYPQSQIYLGVQNGTKIYLTGGVFGQSVTYIDEVDNMLAYIKAETAKAGATLTLTKTIQTRTDLGSFGQVDGSIVFAVGDSLTFHINQQTLRLGDWVLPLSEQNANGLVYAQTINAQNSNEATVFQSTNGDYERIELKLVRSQGLPNITMFAYTLE